MKAAEVQRSASSLLMLSIPKHKVTLLLLAIGLYLVDPLLVIHYYKTQLAAGAYPVNADSIGIPIGQFLIGWIVMAPFLAVILWLSLKDYKVRASLFGFNRSRPLWSGAWTIALGFLAGFQILMAFNNLSDEGSYFYVASYMLWVYIVLCLRASIVYAKPFAKRQDSI